MNSAGAPLPVFLKRTALALFAFTVLSVTAFGQRPAPSLGAIPASALTADTVTPAFCQGVYRGDTSTGIREIDAYPCRPDWPETGPEHYYQLQTTSSQPVTLTLSHPADPGLDLDIFLLEKGDLEQCHAADAALYVDALPPGEHLIVVDGFDGSQGPYTLNVECSQPPLATITPTDTPFPTPTHTPTPLPTKTPTPTVTPTRPKLVYYSYLPAQQQRHPLPTPQPTTIVLQPGLQDYQGLVDSHLNAWENSANYANVDRLALRQPDVMAPVLRFELDWLPENAHIAEAKLELWALSRTNENPATIGAYRLNRAWQVAEVTWLQAQDNQPWAEAGANASPQDRENSPRDVQTISEIQRWQQWDLTALVQQWLDTPTENFGITLKAFAEPRVYYAFASAEYHNPNARPKLTIRYWTPPPSISLGSN